MRALSMQQASRCETAKTKTCKCRCQGALHGKAREVNPTREYFEMLNEDDPHHLPSKEERKQRRKDKKNQPGRQMLLWQIFAPENENDGEVPVN